MIGFFENGRQPNCRAGTWLLIVNPWAKLTPCGMCRDSYDSHAELVKEFTATNSCNECYTAIRANSEKSPYRLLKDALSVVRWQSRS